MPVPVIDEKELRRTMVGAVMVTQAACRNVAAAFLKLPLIRWLLRNGDDVSGGAS